MDEIAAPDMLLQYSLHEPRRGREDIKAFMTDFRKAFPDLNFWGAADLIAEGDYVVGRGKAAARIPVRLSATSWSGTAGQHRSQDEVHGNDRAALKDGKIVEEIGLDDGVRR